MARLLPLRISRLLPQTTTRLASSFSPGPAPPRLPADQQAEFERLQRVASVSSAFQDPSPSPLSTSRHATTTGAATANEPTSADETDTLRSASQPARSTLSADEEPTTRDVNQGLFRGAPPEFEGDTNPKTGEVGGPKNEPLRWGAGGDWSYNGRVTDF